MMQRLCPRSSRGRAPPLCRFGLEARRQLLLSLGGCAPLQPLRRTAGEWCTRTHHPAIHAHSRRARAYRPAAVAGSATEREPLVVVIAGPTGVGKTAVSLQLAKRLGNRAEVISADSVQIYRGLDVGSRKVSVGDRQGIRHHLLDVLPPTDQYTAGDFFAQARAKTREILARGNTPIVVGGTGFWLRWFVRGRPTTPKSTVATRAKARDMIDGAVAEAKARGEEEAGQWQAAVKLLADLGDRETSERLNKNDYFRLERALEIVLCSGKPLRAHLNPNPSQPFDDRTSNLTLDDSGNSVSEGGGAEDGFHFRCFFLYPSSRLALYRALDASCEAMAAGGLLEESMALLSQGLRPGQSTATNAVGYKQFMGYLMREQEALAQWDAQADPDPNGNGGSEWRPEWAHFEDALRDMMMQTRRYAQDQLTWFRKEPGFRWIRVENDLNNGVGPRTEDAVGVIFERLMEEEAEGVPVDASELGSSDKGKLSREERKALKGYGGSLEVFRDPAQRHQVLARVQNMLQR